ncbi:hypothetical protein P5673_030185 [Acropora cervicornis]|uniref:Transient receptor potential cation channel subfamily A member 1 n=1 Tax=Acropora cervicornis TaxID=6130 RepID=A0AAD9PUL5_ACRCE|nr:hypothetical protein P5673_030185 [Acropora cervicornis]
MMHMKPTEFKGMERIPRLVPDADALPEYHYMTVKNIPLTDNIGKDHLPDDWQLRPNIRTLFVQKTLSIEDTDAIKEVSQKFIVEEKHVKSYLEHLSSLETMTNIRQKQREGSRQEKNARDVSDNKKEELVEYWKIASLTVAELDKYFDHHKLCKKGKKGDKIRRIMTHYYFKCGGATPKDYPVAGGDERVGSANSENETDSDDDLSFYLSDSEIDSSVLMTLYKTASNTTGIDSLCI